MHTLIAQVSDRAACAAWSPIQSHADVVALGTKDSGGTGFETTGGTLELIDLKLSDDSDPVSLGSIATDARFASIAWTTYTGENKYPLGLIAGGTTEGTVHVWNAAALMGSKKDEPPPQNALIATLEKHGSGPVPAMQFSPLQPEQLATGGVSGQLWIWNLQTQESYTVDGTSSAEITAVAWNTQVAHILAAAGSDGSVAVWDLQKKSKWCDLRADHAAISNIAWHPHVGLHLLTASGDSSNTRSPKLKLWDLGSSTSMPLTTLMQGNNEHEAGVLSTSWNPHDETLLLSCGKDNRTLLFDLLSLQVIGELDHSTSASTEPQASVPASTDPATRFASSVLQEQKHLRYFCAWSPLKRGICLTCSLDKTVQAHSVLGLATQAGRPPQWMKPSKVVVSTGFGGMLLSTGDSSNNKVVTIRTIAEHENLVRRSNQFEADLEQQSVTEFCQARRKDSPKDAPLWAFLQDMFAENARQNLLKHLGFDATAIAEAASRYLDTTDEDQNGVENLSLDDNDKKALAASDRVGQDMVQKLLVVGNFEAAVDCCFQMGKLADALVISSCGGAELWQQTQERYFALETKTRPYLSIVGAILHSQLDDLVAQSKVWQWQETLAILCTYAKSEDFSRLCIALGDRLVQAGDAKSASLCYVCSLNLERSVQYWKMQLEAANKIKGGLDLDALHEFVVKVTIFCKAAGAKTELPADVSLFFSQYAQLLAEQGLLATAAKYSQGTSEPGKILRDRLYRSRASRSCYAMLGTAPEFPFTMVAVDKSRAPSGGRQTQAARGGRQQQQAYGGQQTQHQQAYGGQQTQQQQSYGAQQAYSTGGQPSAQYQVPLTAAPTSAANDQLPAGWTALRDPSSGRTYYANQTTGETTWDKPQGAPAVQRTVQSAPNTAQVQQTQPSVSEPSTPSKKSSLVSKYGDGFVTSASHPELATQYGNVGTSNPYHGHERPGTAAAVVAPNQNTNAPISGTMNIDSLEMPQDLTPVKDTLLAYLAALQSAQLTAGDKRQLTEAEKGVAILVKKLARGSLSEDTVTKVNYMVGAISNQDFATASAYQTQLVNSDWRDQKDWLKGLKLLIQLASKKL